MGKNKNCIDCGCTDNTAPVMPPLGSGGDCPQPEPCSTVTQAQCVVYRGNDISCGETVIATEGDRLPAILENLVEFVCEEALGEDAIISVTLSELNSLISDQELQQGRSYKITDNGVILKAITSSLISSSGHREMRIVKPEYYVPATGILGVWYAGLTPSTNDVAVWGGRVWQNVSGNVGTPVDDLTLDTEWTLIPTSNSTYYQTKVFGCTYDLLNNWVASQWDDRGNVFTYDYQTEAQQNAAGYNYIDFSDWGNINIFNNKAWGIFNNTGIIYGNLCEYLIFSNVCPIISYNKTISGITSNTCGGIDRNLCESISSNSNNGVIQSNVLPQSLNSNTNNGDISYNRNNGAIQGNENNGDISYNTNNGSISGIGSANDNIQYNTNNGNITTTTTGGITDPVVNK